MYQASTGRISVRYKWWPSRLNLACHFRVMTTPASELTLTKTFSSVWIIPVLSALWRRFSGSQEPEPNHKYRKLVKMRQHVTWKSIVFENEYYCMDQLPNCLCLSIEVFLKADDSVSFAGN